MPHARIRPRQRRKLQKSFIQMVMELKPPRPELMECLKPNHNRSAHVRK